MAILRFKALELVDQRTVVAPEVDTRKISDFFGQNVFGPGAMRATMSADYFKRVQAAVVRGQKS